MYVSLFESALHSVILTSVEIALGLLSDTFAMLRIQSADSSLDRLLQGIQCNAEFRVESKLDRTPCPMLPSPLGKTLLQVLGCQLGMVNIQVGFRHIRVMTFLISTRPSNIKPLVWIEFWGSTGTMLDRAQDPLRTQIFVGYSSSSAHKYLEKRDKLK